MLNIKRMKEIIKERSEYDEWYHGIEKCWKELTKVLSEDIASTIRYIDTECDEEEFSWLSEVFWEVGKKTHSQEFVNCLWRYADKHPEICDEYNIKYEIEEAQAEINSK